MSTKLQKILFEGFSRIVDLKIELPQDFYF